MFAMKTKSELGCFSNVFGVSSRSSRWRKASKCKQHIQNLICSVELHRKRRECMVRQSRSDIAQLLPNGRFSEALPKAKQFYEDEGRLLAYDQVEYFCKSILQSISILSHQSDVHMLPDVTKEAMAGLIFAASRIGELNELQYIRIMFVERFGREFDKDCVDLRRGNIVCSEIVKILDTKMPQDEITDIVMELSQKYHSNISISANSISDCLASSNDLGIGNSDAEKMKSIVRRKLLHPNLGESERRDRSFMR